MVSVGEKLPEGKLFELTGEGPKAADTASVFGGKTVALFGVPGAFTPTCHNAHVPSFVGAAEALGGKGVDEIVCISVNDPFVMGNWAKATGAADAGIRMMGDADGSWTKALGLDFDGSAVGLGTRCKRFSALVSDGTVKVLNVEESPGEAVCSLGEVLVDQI
ncbi:peroxiredoxin [Rhodobacteraceae bacterium NNCM2]|nr:peroxiredoxin [Coraliihabitans acroporae]